MSDRCIQRERQSVRARIVMGWIRTASREDDSLEVGGLEGGSSLHMTSPCVYYTLMDTNPMTCTLWASLVVLIPNNAPESWPLQQWRRHTYVKLSSSPSRMEHHVERLATNKCMGFDANSVDCTHFDQPIWSDAKSHGDGEQESDHFPV